MRRLFGIFVFLVLVAPSWATALPVCAPGFTGPSSVGPQPIAQVFVNGVCHDVSGEIRPLPDNPKMSLLVGTVQTAEAAVVVTATLNPDPFITFGATTTNLVAGPVTYAFLFGTPVVPGFYNHVTSTGGVTVTNGLENGLNPSTTTVGVSGVFPTFISAYGTLGGAATNLGVDLGNSPCASGPAAPFTNSKTCSQGTLAKTFPPAFYDNLEALLTYTQDDIASVASWSGGVTLSTVVPEPASMSLLAIGAALVAIGYRTRNRR